MDKAVLENNNRIVKENAELKWELKKKNTELKDLKKGIPRLFFENFPPRTYNAVLYKEEALKINFIDENFNEINIKRCPHCGCSVFRVYGKIVPVDDEAQYIAELKKHNPEGKTVSTSTGRQDPKDIKLDPEQLRNVIEWDLICSVCNNRFMLVEEMTTEEMYPYGFTENLQTSEIAQG